MAKSWWKSKTIIVNVVALIASILTASGIADLSSEVQNYIVMGIMAVANIGLRATTSEPIGK